MPFLRARVFLASLASLSLAACSVELDAQRVTEKEERRFQVTGTPEVVLSTFDGSIAVRAWDKPEVLVTVEKQAANAEMARAIKVVFEQTGDRVSVEVKKPEEFTGLSLNSNRSASLIVSVPKASNLQARSGDGGIQLEGIRGHIEVQSGDGGIRGRGLSGDMSVRTGDGAVSLDEVSGTLDLNTGDGGVQVSGALARVRAHTGDGAVTVRALAGSRTAEDWEVTTGDGAVSLELPDNFGAELDAHTGDGGVTLEGVSVTGGQAQSRDGEKPNDVRGTLGSGGKLLRIRTGDGPVHVRRG
jgi:DUF4097 and DUF4098 domain-containing protein YvlB